MNKNEKNLNLLNGIFITSLIVSNIVAVKIVNFWGLTTPAALVIYPVTFLMTDVIGEIWGKDEANRTVILGFYCQCLSLTFITLAMLLPVAPFADNQAEFETILGSSFRLVLSSLVAYLCSQTWDVYIFHKIRDAYIKKFGSRKGGRWLWNNLSTMTSQIIDTVIFIIGGFYGVVPNIFVMIVSQYLLKFVYAALDTIPFYILTCKDYEK